MTISGCDIIITTNGFGLYLIGGDAVKFTNGFPSRLVYSVLPFPVDTGNHNRIVLIPEMNFTCNGSIVGYKAAGSITGNHEIQVWRETSHPHPGVHYDKIDGRQIGDSSCTAAGPGLVKCRLMHPDSEISVQSGDILGLKLPRTSELMFATATKAPTNYVFREGVSTSVASPELLPQITLEIESGI
jgi:hypothetical protein